MSKSKQTKPAAQEAAAAAAAPQEGQESPAGESTAAASSPAPTRAEKAAGYRVTSWYGHPNYECLSCPEKLLDEAAMKRHVKTHATTKRS